MRYSISKKHQLLGTFSPDPLPELCLWTAPSSRLPKCGVQKFLKLYYVSGVLLLLWLFRWFPQQQRILRKNELSVVVGAHALYSHERWRKRHTVAQFVEHEKYSNATMLYDVMLVRLTGRIRYSKKVRPICVDEDAKRPPGTPCVVTGWGSSSPDLKSLCTSFQSLPFIQAI